MVGAVMSLYDGAKTRVRVGCAYSKEFKTKMAVHQGSVLWPLLFAIVVDIITKNARRGMVNKLPYADSLVLLSETMVDLKESFWNWKDALETKGLKVSIKKTKVMVSRSKGEQFKSKADLGGVCGKRVMANSLVCTKCETGFMADVQK